MSIHIAAKKAEIASRVLLSGDPLRAQYMAEHFLDNPQLVNSIRSAFFYTGTYKGVPVTIGTSGMGFPSIGIYSYELFKEYDVDAIIRVGTCGAYSPNLKLFDLVNVEFAVSESTFAKYACGIEEQVIPHCGKAFDQVNTSAAALALNIHACPVHSTDVFYSVEQGIPALAAAHQCLAVEMEAFALFANAQYLQKTAATILTVSDLIYNKDHITPDQRERALQPMIHLALETAIAL